MTTNFSTSTPVHPVPPGPRPAYPGQHLVALMRDPLNFLTEAAVYDDEIVLLTSGRQNNYLIRDPEIIRDVLVTNHRMFIKSPVLQRMRRVLGEGLLTSEGELHLRQRRLIQPAFHRQRIAGYAQVMTDTAQKISAHWQDGETRDIHIEMMRLTMIVVGHALFGTDVENESAEIGQAITTLLGGSRRLLLPFWEQIQKLPLPMNKRLNAAQQQLDDLIQKMVNDRRAAIDLGAAEPASDLLDMLLIARDEAGDGQGMSDQLIRDEVLTLFLAGHETTANALTWTWYLLSQHPEVEAKLHAELSTILNGRVPTADDLDRLPYARKVLTESMRLYPPSWTISRQALVDYTVGKYVLPAGSVLMISQWIMHHDPRFFPDPDRFDPERWTDEQAVSRPKFAYFPFGGGPRLCVGEPFAWMEGILILATLAQRWQLRLDPNQKIALLPQVTLRPKYGMRMKINHRTEKQPNGTLK